VVRAAARDCAALIVPSEATATDCAELLDIPRDRLFVTPLGVDPAWFDLPPAPEGGRPYLLAIGTLEPRKNYARLIRAYRAAFECGAAGPLLGRLFQNAFATAKRVRSETRIAERPVSVARVAVELARQIFEDLSKKQALLIGAGEMIEMALESLRGDGLEAIKLFEKLSPDVVTMDLTMPNMEGIECIENLVAIKPDVLILVVSALADKSTAIEALKKGAHGFLCKPFSEDDLNDALRVLLKGATHA